MGGARDQLRLAHYLPSSLVRRIATRGVALSRCVEDRSWGATLLVDLAAFTQLTERFAAVPAGAEQLSDILNDHFGKMTTTVAGFGGDVVLYAGDAILALWPAAAAGALPEAIALATQCALEVNKPFSGLGGGVVLRQRAVVSAGAISSYEVGGLDERWLSLLAGPAWAGVAEALHEARVGEVVLTQAAWQLVGDRCRVLPTAKGNMRVAGIAGASGGSSTLLESEDRQDPLPPPDSLLAPYVLEVLAERITAGHGAWLAEFRPVTVLFVGLGQLADAGGELEKIQIAAFAAQKELRQQGGTLYQAATDDKGTVLIGIFGLPLSAQENGPLRGVEAAMALRSRLGESGITASVGVATGRVFCGSCGNDRRKQYTVVGPAMNLAARLMQTADGGVLCDAATEERARHRIDFDDLAPVSVKGLSARQSVFVPIGRRAVSPVHPPLVGRAREEQRLRALVQGLAEGRGGVVIVEGTAGIGKSSLLATVAESVSLLPGMVLRGECEAIERSTPYFAWRTLLRGLLRAGPEEKGPALVERLTQRLADLDDAALLRWLPLLGVMAPLGVADNEFTANMESEARAGAVQQLLLRMLQKDASRAPIALIVDDIQWIDSASATLIRAVAERLPQLLIVTATRPVDPAGGAAGERILLMPGIERFVLGPLSPDAIRALACRCLEVSQVDDTVAHFVMERAGGHPLFSEELVRAIRYSDLLEFSGGAAILGQRDIRSVKFPDSVHAAITSRVDRLIPHELLALKTASVVGESFSRDEVEAAYPEERDRPLLRGALENLERLDLIRRDGDGNHESFGFRHALVHEAVYDLLPISHRRHIHKRIALFYEGLAADARTDAYPLLARHWDEAGDAEKAVAYLERAASEAVRVFSSREAESFLRRADELTRDHPSLADPIRLAIREKVRGEAAYQQANYAESYRHFCRSLELRQVRVPRTSGGMAADLTGQIARQLARRTTQWWRRPTLSASDRETLEHAAFVFNRFTSLAWYRGDQLALVHGIFKVLNLAEKAGDVSNMVHASAAMAVLCGLVGWHKAADYYSGRALAMAEASQNPSDGARAHVNTAIYAIGSCLWSSAAEHVERALDLHFRLGDTLHWEGCLALKGYLYLGRGEFAPATPCFDEVYRSSRDGRIQSRIWARTGHLAVQIPTGVVSRATVEELSELAVQMPDTAESIASHGLVAHAYLRMGDIAKANVAAELGLRRLMERKPAAVYYAYWGIAALAEAWLALWEANADGARRSEGLRRAAQACRMLRAFSRTMPIARPRSALCDARLALLAGREPQGLRRIRQGIELAQRLKMPFDEALLHAAASSVQLVDGKRAVHLATAAALLETQGARGELALIQGASHKTERRRPQGGAVAR